MYFPNSRNTQKVKPFLCPAFLFVCFFLRKCPLCCLGTGHMNLQFFCLSLLGSCGYRHMTMGFTFKSTFIHEKNHEYFIFNFIIKISITFQNICKKILKYEIGDYSFDAIKLSPMIRLLPISKLYSYKCYFKKYTINLQLF